MSSKKDVLQRIIGGPFVFFGTIGAILGMLLCLVMTLALIVRFNEIAPTIIFAGTAVMVAGLIYRSYRKNQYWSGK
jgi:hypothetical protein